MTYSLIVKKIFETLSRKHKLFLILIFFSILLSAFLEMLTISSLVPFLNIMLNPELVYENFDYKYLVISEKLFVQNPLGYISLLFILIIVGSTLVKLLVLKLILRVTTMIGTKISSQVFKNIISQSYIEFTRFNTSELISVLESKVDPLVNSIFKILQTFSAILITLAITVTLLNINFWSTVFFALAFSISYLILFSFYKNQLNSIGVIIASNLKSRVKTSQESMSIFRQVKLDNLSEKFYKNFIDKDFAIRKGTEISAYIGNFPRIVIECIAIILIALGSYYLISNNIYDEDYTFTLITAIVFGASRLLPQVQIIYYNLSQIVSQKKIYLDVVKFLNNEINLNEKLTSKKVINFNSEISLKGVSFAYEKNNTIFENINLDIKKNSTIGILGKTGSGKTTLIDLIAGLLCPNEGKVLVDQEKIDESLNSWQSKISYIDQNVTLLDGSIIDNISLQHQNNNEINVKFFNEILEISQAKEFINKLPNGYHTKIGERGIRLSGGQIQRIGIARALFKNSELLILDEPTSSLDVDTENQVIEAIEKLKKKKTIILISHRINTLKNCDKVFEVKNKKVNEVRI